MKEEEAFTLRLRGYDTRREALQAQLGFAGKSLRQIIEAAGQQDRPRLERAHALLGERAEKLQLSVGLAKDAINAQLTA